MARNAQVRLDEVLYVPVQAPSMDGKFKVSTNEPPVPASSSARHQPPPFQPSFIIATGNESWDKFAAAQAPTYNFSSADWRKFNPDLGSKVKIGDRVYVPRSAAYATANVAYFQQSPLFKDNCFG